MDIQIQKAVRYDQKRSSPQHIIVKWLKKKSGQIKNSEIYRKKKWQVTLKGKPHHINRRFLNKNSIGNDSME
jgi:hypothetical protein